MNIQEQKILEGRFCPFYLFSVIFLAISFITRTVLLLKSLPVLNLNILLLTKIYGIGLFYDAVTMLYFSVPFVFYLTVIPDKLYQNRFHKLSVYFVSFTILCLLVFSSFGEYLFFNEFGTRYNFIAVDYLIYTTEVTKNIQESYPLSLILSAIACISLALFIFSKKYIDISFDSESTFGERAKKGIVFLIIPLLPFIFIDLSLSKISSNNYANELSSNGIYSFFAALKNNQIDYETFYTKRDNRLAFNKLRELLKEPNNTFSTDNIFDITRQIKNNGKEKRLNVVVIIVESLSAEYLGIFGNKDSLTPNLDRLAEASLLFTNVYATWTRTDRGLEAITLSLPPTPGRSIVKRPDNENIFSWGFIMRSRGYDTKFIYGGYGYFDNMNYFFSHNGFETIDRRNIATNDIHFENAWGVCDEDLFDKAIKEFNTSFKNNKPFFAEIMTTSNHRPYIYPDGRIDILSKTGRNGAVKYTDYAIGKFIKDAQKEPWFRDTIFVIVADHCASSAGKTKLPMKKYEIPMLIYAPAHLTPQKIDKLASQIDIAPTVLGLLNFSYKTKFFGRDILKMQKEQERALIGTYEKLGYVKNDNLIILDVKNENSMYQLNRHTGEPKRVLIDKNLLDEAISYYQGASYLYKNNLNRWDIR
jgi:phosphoglycerol transferase MdoB-like AlkP superfamily enzyme